MTTTPDWDNIIKEIAANPGVVMVIGGVDTGKTHFCVELCNAGVEAGIATAVVDADVGQSEIGSPGTIGMALAERPIEALSDLKPRRLYFIGTTSPVHHTLECVVGSGKMVDAALALGAKLVVLDTTGLVDGPIGRKLKTYKADLVRPNYLIGIEKRREIEHLLSPWSKIASIKVMKAKSSELARKKPQEFRAARRRRSFYNHFANASVHIIKLDEISTSNTWFCSGRPMKWQYVKFIEKTTRCRILHAEITGKGIFAVSERPCSAGGYRELEEEFKTRNITITSVDVLRGLLVGLADEDGNVMNVGLIQEIDFKQRYMSVLSPIKTVSPVRMVQFGSMRVAKDGRELGMVEQRVL